MEGYVLSGPENYGDFLDPFLSALSLKQNAWNQLGLVIFSLFQSQTALHSKSLRGNLMSVLRHCLWENYA